MASTLYCFSRTSISILLSSTIHFCVHHLQAQSEKVSQPTMENLSSRYYRMHSGIGWIGSRITI